MPPQADTATALPPKRRLWNGMAVIATGANRVCVTDPGMPGYCLKYQRCPDPQVSRPLRHRLRNWWRLRGPGLDSNAIEWRSWQWMYARIGDALDTHVAHCNGPVQTSAGPALRCRMVVSGDDPTPAPSLYALLFGAMRGRYDAPTLCAAVTRFEAWLHRNSLPLFDLNSGNFVVVERDDRAELVCIDVKSVLGGKESIPVSRWSHRLMQRKIARRAERLRQRIRAHAPLAGARPPN